MDAPPEPAEVDWSEYEAALVNRVCVLRSVEWWKANDAAFGLVGWPSLASFKPGDGFSRHGLTLWPLKRQWGVA